MTDAAPAADSVCTLHRGSRPLLLSLPHVGTALPDSLKPRLVPRALAVEDTDWHLEQLYGFASRGYGIVIAEDAHTTADRPAAQAATLIAHYNEVWRTLTIPGNPLQVKPTETILHAWQQN